MQVRRWGGSLAVRLRRGLVERLGLRASGPLTLAAAGERRVTLARDDSWANALASMERPAPHLP
jgi:antitoxin component of MazEF toxin-antitoxin module